MDLIEKYIDSVRMLLPLSQRDDIAEELDGVLRGKMEERAAQLGRKLTRSEEEQVLKDYGHPAMVAARYLPQGTLIGPELYPFWWLGARAAVAVDVILHFIRMMLVLFDTPDAGDIPYRLGHVWGSFWTTGFVLIGALTVSLAVIERFKLNPFGDWSPGDLKAMPQMARGKRPTSRIESGGAIMGTLVGVAFWAALPWLHDFGPLAFGTIRITDLAGIEMVGGMLTPIWFPVLWAMILAGGVLNLAGHIAAFARPADRAMQALWRVASYVLGAATGVVALTSGPLFNMDNRLGRIIHLVSEDEQWIHLGIGVSVAVSVGLAIWNVWRWREARKGLLQSSGPVTG